MRYLLFLVVVTFIGCSTEFETKPLEKYNSLQHIEYDEPMIGMDYLEFSKLCVFGDSGEDRISRNKTSTYDVIVVRLGETRIRMFNGCYGKFVFRNAKLILISD